MLVDRVSILGMCRNGLSLANCMQMCLGPTQSPVLEFLFSLSLEQECHPVIQTLCHEADSSAYKFVAGIPKWKGACQKIKRRKDGNIKSGLEKVCRI